MGQMIKKVMESWDIMLHGIEVIDRVSFQVHRSFLLEKDGKDYALSFEIFD